MLVTLWNVIELQEFPLHHYCVARIIDDPYHVHVILLLCMLNQSE